jgi:hypothetical protein
MIYFLRWPCLWASFLLFLFAVPSRTAAQVTYRDTLLSWSHFDYSLDENNGMDWYSTSSIVQEEYPGIVMENEYIRLVVLPGFGARVISFLYKPTGHEQFYTNPVGVPYGMGDGNFYYDWLMVFGGVFPTFPEPEHGKTWFLPWQWEFSVISDDKLSLKMEIQDTINYPYHPGKFNNGITGVRCTSTITVEKGKTCFELQHTIENTKAEPVTLEYWTCTTLAPGSETGDTYTPASSEIIAPIDYVYLKDDWWSWMGNAETPAPGQGSHVFTYKNLAIYDNWEDMGIAYAFPDIAGEYYGVLNHENSEGVFRVADNAGITPGMKFWTWGAQQGLNADPMDFYDIARPYIELWSGLSTQFFEDAALGASETLSWTETYLPTAGMDSITLVNESGALHLNAVADENDRFVTKAFMTLPDSLFHLKLNLAGDVDIDLFEGEFYPESETSTVWTQLLGDYIIPDGDYAFVATITGSSGQEVLSSSIPVTIPFPTNAIGQVEMARPKLVRMAPQLFMLEFKEPQERKVRVYSVNGQHISAKSIVDRQAFIRIDQAGMYIIRVEEEGTAHSIKVMVN